MQDKVLREEGRPDKVSAVVNAGRVLGTQHISVRLEYRMLKRKCLYLNKKMLFESREPTCWILY